MADVVKTCANCGNMQASGDFCEKCGTRMPAAPAPGPAPTYPAAEAPAPGMAAPQPPPYISPAQYVPPATPAPQYGYSPPMAEQYRPAGPGLFDFVGAMNRTRLKLLWWVVLGMIGLYVLFNIIYVAMAGGKFAVIAFFASLFVAGFMFVVSWVLFEGLGIALKLRDKADGQ